MIRRVVFREQGFQSWSRLKGQRLEAFAPIGQGGLAEAALPLEFTLQRVAVVQETRFSVNSNLTIRRMGGGGMTWRDDLRVVRWVRLGARTAEPVIGSWSGQLKIDIGRRNVAGW